MPSSPGYNRNYKQEEKTAGARGEKAGHNARDRARYKLEKAGMVKKGDGKDVDHKKPVSKGGTNAASNLRVESEHANRSFPRRPDGSMVKNKAKTK
jgi:hypothetical protein